MSPHRSRLVHFVIDVDDLDEATRFWAAALAADEEQVNRGSEHVYRRLRVPGNDVRVLLQLTDDRKTGKERMHLDIETDDVDAEVARLENLGARRVEKVLGWWVMAAPTGHRFCVVPVARAGFDERANRWE